MTKEKIAAFFKEMPWLSRLLDTERKLMGRDMPVGQAYVSGFDVSLSDLCPMRIGTRKHDYLGNTVFYMDERVEPENSETIYFIDAEGNAPMLFYEYEVPTYRRHLLFFEKKLKEKERKRDTIRPVASASSYSEGKTLSVREQLWFLEKVPIAAAVLRYAVSYSAYTKAVIVYRPPGGGSIWKRMQELEEERKGQIAEAEAADQSRLEIRAEIASIDGGSV
ncbi:MAG TPA: hypothetical protein VHD69_03155 [Candidatus Paceibacterota bacterium]|nr:hypothetical protein [Candidatus Paceibacterota bacterium]